jgi:predicted nucleic acid-binding protein
MTVVVDASVLVAAATDSGSAGLWAEGLMRSEQLLAPHVVLAEATNALRRLERMRQLTTIEASDAFRAILDFRLELHSFGRFADRVFELRTNLSAYDAWYVAIAESFGVALATVDTKLTRSTGPQCRFLTP